MHARTASLFVVTIRLVRRVWHGFGWWSYLSPAAIGFKRLRSVPPVDPSRTVIYNPTQEYTPACASGDRELRGLPAVFLLFPLLLTADARLSSFTGVTVEVLS